jgi:hypothetical protein
MDHARRTHTPTRRAIIEGREFAAQASSSLQIGCFTRRIVYVFQAKRTGASAPAVTTAARWRIFLARRHNMCAWTHMSKSGVVVPQPTLRSLLKNHKRDIRLAPLGIGGHPRRQSL